MIFKVTIDIEEMFDEDVFNKWYDLRCKIMISKDEDVISVISKEVEVMELE